MSEVPIDARVVFTAVAIAQEVDEQPTTEEVRDRLIDFLKTEFDVVFIDRASITVEYLERGKCEPLNGRN
jgi:predicted O-methyltransferase YrrM